MSIRMPIGSFENCPVGQHFAVCADVVDGGMVSREWNGKVRPRHEVRIVYLTDETMEDGRPYSVSQRFTLTSSEKGRLRPFLEQWRGKPYTMNELQEEPDLERLIGVQADIQVVHVQKGDKTYANIQSIRLPRKGDPVVAIPRDYVRAKDRKQDAGVAQGASGGNFREQLEEEEDDDLPF